MNKYVLGFHEIDRSKFMAVGGKGANLGELCTIKEIRVPDGFCVTTEAYKKITENNQKLESLWDDLSLLNLEDRDKIVELSSEIRMVIEGIAIPQDIQEESPASSPGLVKKMRMQFDPVQLRRIYRRHLSQASRTPI